MSLERIADSLDNIARLLQTLVTAQATARKPDPVDTRSRSEKWHDDRGRAKDLARMLMHIGAPGPRRFAVALMLAERGQEPSRTTLLGAVSRTKGIGEVRAVMWSNWIDEKFPPATGEP